MAVQECSIRIKRLEFLVSILKCMLSLYDPLYPSFDIGYTDDFCLHQDSIFLYSVSPIYRSTKAIDNAEVFESLKQKKVTKEKGIQLFNKNPSKGIKFLQSEGLLGETAMEVAQFLHTDDTLDKTMIGELIGDPGQYEREIMYA
ncbi:brefeldin A-inhibited guanine nucleotide-exchange protein 2-like [Xenia sp. Carnegie-2017]|uniref:brefeldin A-inhibited guanine nucleotide-exchange protein 2-like n=1 Tax=Xenia sp. Carnegie-2017 TaxID=2897299 RepID=UPI001F0355F8|nr:brefeldin A-inhibited guanine nucleotide-exchange protein 2-like [Xenia sp. Carnegie-2017]